MEGSKRGKRRPDNVKLSEQSALAKDVALTRGAVEALSEHLFMGVITSQKAAKGSVHLAWIGLEEQNNLGPDFFAKYPVVATPPTEDFKFLNEPRSLVLGVSEPLAHVGQVRHLQTQSNNLPRNQKTQRSYL